MVANLDADLARLDLNNAKMTLDEIFMASAIQTTHGNDSLHLEYPETNLASKFEID